MSVFSFEGALPPMPPSAMCLPEKALSLAKVRLNVKNLNDFEAFG